MKEGKQNDEDRRGMMVGGFITLGIGILFLLHNLDIIPDFDVLWPIIPIIVGISLIVGAVIKGKKPDQPE